MVVECGLKTKESVNEEYVQLDILQGVAFWEKSIYFNSIAVFIQIRQAENLNGNPNYVLNS